MPFTLAVHGGAGTIARSNANEADEAPYHAGLRAALAAGQMVLARGGAALDAVVAAVIALEDEPLFNAGRGSVYTADATHETDAGVMDGRDRRAGAVAGLRSVRNPVQLAREVMDATEHVLMIGDGAERLARERGVPLAPPEYFATDTRRRQLQQAQAAGRGAALDHDVHKAPLPGQHKRGTVGAVACDAQGHLAAAVSTGGMTNKRPGRVGNSPLVGAGLFADDATAAICCTGSGEHFIRAVAAHAVHARTRWGAMTLAQAAEATVSEELTPLGGDGGLIAVDRHGALAMRFNSAGMYRGWIGRDGVMHTAIFR
ncbi:MAG: isoaspartyl peptidase/L-asparaginase [Burkholderiaceae bacterium]|nr:isoaspartyl peptidase/L-asparaginase [Burkholderiaceae bacterium]